MINTRNDLRQGTLWKQILFFSLPIAATSMLQQLFNSADVAVVGRFSAQKDLALAAVGSTSSVVNLFITIITGLAVGANVVIARSIGASDEKRARQAVHTALILSLLCGAILLVLGECIPAFAGDHGYAVGHHRPGGKVSENLQDRKSVV